MEEPERWPHRVLATAAIVLIALIVVVEYPGGDVEAWVAPARQALAPFKRDLKHALERGLAAGPEQAIEACRAEALRIARTHSGTGVRVGRTSLRLRNPANAPAPWQRPILDDFARTPVEQLGPRVVRIDGDRVGYVEPIVLGPVCLTCHGSTLDPTVAARIDALYPDDQARGFALGELRGAFWVELEREAPGAGGKTGG